jgi:hypothetical protein
MEERDERRDPVAEQLVDQAVVEVEALLVHRAASAGDDPRPCDRQPEGVDPELAHERDVLAVAVVEVARDRTAVAVPDLAGRCAEAIPDALTAAVLGGCALDLKRGGRGTPDEVSRKRAKRQVGHGGPLVDGVQ